MLEWKELRKIPHTVNLKHKVMIELIDIVSNEYFGEWRSSLNRYIHGSICGVLVFNLSAGSPS